MKLRSVLFILTFILLTQLFSLNISAAGKQDVINAARNAIPPDYGYLYLIQLENILSQIEISEENCDRIIEIIDELAQSIKDSGHTLHLYAEENVEYILELFDEICTLCDLTYEYRPAAKQPHWHPGDVECLVYDSGGRLLGVFDGDLNIVKSTGSKIGSFVLPLPQVFCAAAVFAAAVYIYINNRKFLNRKVIIR